MAWTRSQTIGARAEARDPGVRPVDGDRADWAAAAVLHERYLEDVFRYVLRRVPSVPEAEEITAEVFAAAVPPGQPLGAGHRLLASFRHMREAEGYWCEMASGVRVELTPDPFPAREGIGG